MLIAGSEVAGKPSDRALRPDWKLFLGTLVFFTRNKCNECDSVGANLDPDCILLSFTSFTVALAAVLQNTAY